MTRAQGGPVCGHTWGVARHPLPALKPACGCRALASGGLRGLPAPFAHIALPGPVLWPSFSVMSFVASSPCRPWRPGVWPPSLLSEHTSGVAFLTTCTCRGLPDWLSSHRLLATSQPPPRGCPQVLCISQIPGANLERRRLSRSWTGGWSCGSPAGQAGASAWAPAGCDFCVRHCTTHTPSSLSRTTRSLRPPGPYTRTPCGPGVRRAGRAQLALLLGVRGRGRDGEGLESPARTRPAAETSC